MKAEHKQLGWKQTIYLMIYLKQDNNLALKLKIEDKMLGNSDSRTRSSD